MTAYDYDGNVAQVAQPNGDTTVTVYDFLDRPTSTEIDTAVVDAPTKQTVESQTYDAAGNPTSSIDFDGRTHLSQYDADNRDVQATDYYSFTATLTTTATPCARSSRRRGHRAACRRTRSRTRTTRRIGRRTRPMMGC